MVLSRNCWRRVCLIFRNRPVAFVRRWPPPLSFCFLWRSRWSLKYDHVMLMKSRGKWGIFHGPFKKLLWEGPPKLMKLTLFALSLLLSIDLVLNLLTPRYWILNWIKFWGWLLTLWPPPLARCPSGRFRKSLNEWIFEAVEVSSKCWVW